MQPTSTLVDCLLYSPDKNPLGKLSQSFDCSEAIQVLLGRACSNGCQPNSHF